jgi:inner membrane protein
LLKTGAIAFLILLLHIPLLMVRGTLLERRQSRNEAVASISRSWGGSQELIGPFLAIPAVWTRTVDAQVLVDGKVVEREKTVEKRGCVYLFPETLSIDGDIETSTLYRGIYEAVVYRTKASIFGTFDPSEQKLSEQDGELDWNRARIVFGLSDLRGIADTPDMRLAGRRVVLEPGTGLSDLASGLSAPLGEFDRDNALPFEIDLSFQGSGSIATVPAAARNEATLIGTWSSPSFHGGYLPVDREVTDAGFTARWEVSSFGRPFPQVWSDRSSDNAANWQALRNSIYGVHLITPVDAYRTVERSLKYGILFFILIFTVFFLFEVIVRIRVHPFQYLLVGAALCLFYLGFLSLGELVGQGVAYLLSATACIIMVTLYSISVLHSGARGLYVAAGLAVTYGCLYLVLRMEDFALLAGTFALFAALSLVMFLTRRIDWYQMENKEENNSPASLAGRAN